jgi:hypothetical protein
MKKTYITITALLALCASMLTTQAQDKKPLTVKLPELALTGTPVAVPATLTPYVDNALQRPVILVPEGTTNIAKGKPVTSSDSSPIVGELSYVTDGDKDGDEGFEVELAPGLQWVQIDLKKTSDIYAIALWHFHRQQRVYRAVIVQISDDAEFKTGVTTVLNTDYANFAKLGVGKDKGLYEKNEGRLIAVNGVKGRYVRLYSAGNHVNPGNHYVEVEVYGK